MKKLKVVILLGLLLIFMTGCDTQSSSGSVTTGTGDHKQTTTVSLSVTDEGEAVYTASKSISVDVSMDISGSAPIYYKVVDSSKKVIQSCVQVKNGNISSATVNKSFNYDVSSNKKENAAIVGVYSDSSCTKTITSITTHTIKYISASSVLLKLTENDPTTVDVDGKKVSIKWSVSPSGLYTRSVTYNSKGNIETENSCTSSTSGSFSLTLKSTKNLNARYAVVSVYGSLDDCVDKTNVITSQKTKTYYLKAVYSQCSSNINSSASKFIQIAQSQVGYKEKSSNSDLSSCTGNAGSGNYNKYSSEMGYGPSIAWCASFVSWVGTKAGISGFPTSASVSDFKTWGSNKSRYFSGSDLNGIHDGDLIIMNGHIGIYYKGDVIHGNWNNQVYQNSVSNVKKNISVLGYVRMKGYTY